MFKPLSFILYSIFIILLFNHNKVFAQPYVAFEYNSKFGIVNGTTLETIVEPQNKMISKFGENYWLYSEEDTIYVYSKINGKRNTYKNYKKGYAYIIEGDRRYFGVEHNNSLHLLSSNLKLINVGNNFSSVSNFENSNTVIIGRKIDTICLYELKNEQLKLKHQFYATSSIKKELIYNNNNQNFQLFYGKEHIYVVDGKGNLVKTVESNAKNTEVIIQLIHPTFKEPKTHFEIGLGSGSPNQAGERNEAYMAKLSKWGVLKSTESASYYGKLGIDFAIIVPNGYSLYRNKQNNTFELASNEIKAAFYVDTIKGKIMLPAKYQHKIGLRVVDYKVKETDDTTIYGIPDKAPLPPNDFITGLEKTLNITVLKKWPGKLDPSFHFTVNQDGSITNIILNQNIKDEEQKAAILNFLAIHNKGWTPATNTGLKVRSNYHVTFKENK